MCHSVHCVQVQEVVLVEVKDAHVQHAANVRIILEQIAPSEITGNNDRSVFVVAVQA